MKIDNLNTIAFLIALSVVTFIVFLILKPFAITIVLSAILVTVFYGSYQRILRVCGGRRGLAALLSCLVIFFIVIVPLLSVLGLVAGATTDFYKQVVADEGEYQRIVGYVTQIVIASPLLQENDVANVLQSQEFLSVVKSASQVTLRIVQGVYHFIAASAFWVFVLFFTSFYLFMDGDRAIRKLMALSPLKDSQERLLISKFVSMSRATLKGTLVIGLIQGVIGWVTFIITGVPYAAVWGVLMIVLSIIPMVGAGLVWMPAGVIMLLSGEIWQGIVILAVGFGVISTIDNILRPKLVGRDTAMHPLFVFFSTVGGIFLLGPAGFIIGPIAMALFLALWDIYGKEFHFQLERYNAAE